MFYRVQSFLASISFIQRFTSREITLIFFRLENSQFCVGDDNDGDDGVLVVWAHGRIKMSLFGEQIVFIFSLNFWMLQFMIMWFVYRHIEIARIITANCFGIKS